MCIKVKVIFLRKHIFYKCSLFILKTAHNFMISIHTFIQKIPLQILIWRGTERKIIYS